MPCIHLNKCAIGPSRATQGLKLGHDGRSGLSLTIKQNQVKQHTGSGSAATDALFLALILKPNIVKQNMGSGSAATGGLAALSSSNPSQAKQRTGSSLTATDALV